MRRLLVPLLVTATGCVGALAWPVAASASTPTPVPLAAAAPSAFGAPVTLLGADAAGVAYLSQQVDPEDLATGTGTAFLLARGASRPTAVPATAAQPGGWDPCSQLSGDLLVDGCAPAAADGAAVVAYHSVAGSLVAGSTTLVEGAVFVAAAGGGYVYCQPSPASTGGPAVVLALPGATPSVRTLTTLAAGDACVGTGAGTATAVVLPVLDQNGNSSVVDVTLANPSTSTSFPVSQATVSAVAVAAGAVGWLATDTADGQSFAVRQPLATSADPHPAAVPTAVPAGTLGVWLTATTTAWAVPAAGGATGTLASVPAAGGAVSTGTLPLALEAGQQNGGNGAVAQSGAAGPGAPVASDGSRFYLGVAGPAGSAGLYAAPDAAHAATVLVTSTPAPASATDVALGPGLAAYGTDATLPLSVLARPLTASNGTLVAGSAGTLGTGALADDTGVDGFDLSLSGDRLASVVGLPDGAEQLRVTTLTPDAPSLGAAGTVVVATVAGGLSDVRLSGDRLLYVTGATGGAQSSTPSARVQLYDLSTRTVTALTSLDADQGFDLWGDYLSYVTGTGAVWRVDLVDPSGTRQVQSAVGTAGDCAGQSLVAGAYVAWKVICTDPVTLNQTGSQGYRDVNTAAAPTPLGSDETPVALSATYLGELSFDPATSTEQTEVRNLGSGAVSVLATGATAGLGLSGDAAGWLDADGQPQASALAAPAPPQLLGAAREVGIAQPGLSDATVTARYSEPLTGCSVAFRLSGAVQATVPCDPAEAALGVATVSWDGSVAGHGTEPGTDTWTVLARGTGGAALPATATGPVAAGTAQVRPAPASMAVLAAPATVIATSLRAGQVVSSPVAGRGGVPATGATAVLLQVSATPAAAASSLTLWGTGASHPATAQLPLPVPGRTATTLVEVPLVNGAVALAAGPGALAVTAAVVGYLAPALPPAALIAEAHPGKLLTTTLRAGASVPVIAGTGAGVPSDATAVLLEMTGQGQGYAAVTAGPDTAGAAPAAQLRTVAAGQRSATALVRLGPGGRLRFSAAGATSTLTAVVEAYLAPVAPAAVSATPLVGAVRLTQLALGFGQIRTVRVAGVAGVPATARSVVVELAGAAGGSAASAVYAWPPGTPRPAPAQLAVPGSGTAASLAVLPLSPTGTLDVGAGAGPVTASLDVVGYQD